MYLFSSHNRQKLLNSTSLKAIQVFLDMFRYRPINGGGNESGPFFIIGSGRSGTSLLRSVLYRHEDIDIPPETQGRVPNCIKKYIRYSGADWEDLVNIVVGEFTSFETFELWEIDPEIVRWKLYKAKKTDRTLYKILDTLFREHIAVHKPGATLWGDKSPFNTLRLKWIDRAFPKAKYIHMIRDGRDVALSYMKSGIITKLDEAAKRWIHSLEQVEKFSNKKNRDAIYTVYYEQLVKNPDNIIPGVCHFLGVDFQEQMLNREPIDLGDNKLEHMKNVNRPIFTDSIFKWKDQLDGVDLEILNKFMKQYLVKYGYEA